MKTSYLRKRIQILATSANAGSSPATLGLMWNFIVALALLALTAPLRAVPAGVDHQKWDALLQKHVDTRGLVDYEAWSASPEDRTELDHYLEQYAPAGLPKAAGDEEVASLINAYNAFTIRFILQNFPTESIRALDDPFGEARHPFEGRKVSLNTIEHKLLRPIIGWKAHAVLVCAARSCPPLLNHAYFANDWESKMQGRYRAWLAREDINRYLPKENRVEISRIFDWYSDDFHGEDSVKSILARFGPLPDQTFLESGDYRIQYLDYRWGLNAQSNLGEGYQMSLWDRLF